MKNLNGLKIHTILRLNMAISNHVNFQFTSQITDAEGRYILVKGFIDHKEVTLVNIYRPPGHNKQ